MASTARAAHPVFVGGTGRSGTTIAGQLIGSSADYALVPIELRFHVDGGGLGDLARGRVSVDEFEVTMAQRWYAREPNSSGPRGVHVITDKPQFSRSFERLRKSYTADPWGSAGRFLDDVIQPHVHARGASSWVEMTPPNARSMHLLSRMLPTARFVHMVRDGRDVASSVARRSWGPNDVPTAIKWWGNHMMAIHRSAALIDPGLVHTARLESLVGSRRSVAYDQLSAFLGLQDDASMKAFFDTKMSEERARPGSWRRGLSAEDQEQVDLLYEEQLARLDAAGASLPPVL